MKVMIILLSVLIILAGILPFLGGFGIVPEPLITSPGYSFVIVAVGVIALIYGVMSKMIFGMEKFVLLAVGIITVLGGLLPFIKGFIPFAVPTSGFLYSGIIILVGVVSLIYGISKVG